MERELNLRISETLFLHLEQQALERGVSLDTLCSTLLSGQKQEESLTDPGYYQSLHLDTLRQEVRRVIESALPAQEVRKRVNAIEFEISRRFIR